MDHSQMRVGMQVLFGRSHGERTLGEVVKVNPARVKVKQLDVRGSIKSHPVGTIWTVPPALCHRVVADGAAPMAPVVRLAPAASSVHEAIARLRVALRFAAGVSATVNVDDLRRVVTALETRVLDDECRNENFVEAMMNAR